MTAEARRRAAVALVVLFSVSFALLAHAALVDRLSPTWGALLSLVPLFGVLLWAVRRAGGRIAATALVLLAAIGLWLGWDSLQLHFPRIFYIEHAGANLLLATLFGRTLREGREPLVTRFARLIHGTLPPEVERYTRRVTLAWTIFFASLFTLSTLLYLGNFIAAWSFLVNILSPLLCGAMFVIEYAIRLRALPNWEQVGILGGIRAFSRHFGGGTRLESTR